MIDLWRRIPGNYVDHGNADDGIQSYNYWRTRETTAHFKDRVQLMYLPMFTIEAADLFPDEHFDYVRTGLATHNDTSPEEGRVV